VDFLRKKRQKIGGKQSMGKRKRYTAQIKAQIAIEAIRGQKTINELAAEYGVHPNQITKWKKQLLSSAPGIFSNNQYSQRRSEDVLKERLYQEIGKLKVELEFLKKKSGYER
jgi:putative transposase